LQIFAQITCLESRGTSRPNQNRSEFKLEVSKGSLRTLCSQTKEHETSVPAYLWSFNPLTFFVDEQKEKNLYRTVTTQLGK